MLLALRLPAGNQRGPLHLEPVLTAIHQANPLRKPVTLLIVQQEGSVELYVRLPPALRSVVLSHLTAAYPEAEIEAVAEVTLAPESKHLTWVQTVRLMPDLAGLRSWDSFTSPSERGTIDPLSTLLAAVTTPRSPDVSVRIELELIPADSDAVALARDQYTKAISLKRHPKRAAWYLQQVRSGVTWRTWLAELATLGTKATRDLLSRSDPVVARLQERLFATTLMIRVTAPHMTKHEQAIFADVRGALATYVDPAVASFVPQHTPQTRSSGRAPPFLLSLADVTLLWHAPTARVQNPGLARATWKQLEPPRALRTKEASAAVTLLGTVAYRDRRDVIGLALDDKRRHVTILGRTGTGKTTLIGSMLMSDIEHGHGVALIDPHGDINDYVIQRIPKRRTNDVLLFDAADAVSPPTYNPFVCSVADRPLVAASIVTALRKLFADSWGPRLQHILHNAILTNLDLPDATFSTLRRLLTENAYRKTHLSRVQNPLVRSFWTTEYDTWDPRFRAEAVAPVLNKLSQLLTHELLRRIVDQPGRTLPIRQIMDHQRILLVNVSKGRLGEDAASLLGSLLIGHLQIAALSRADLPEHDRRDFTLYCDELQNFLSASVETLLSESRKYRVAIVSATQHLGNVEPSLATALLANSGSIVAFGLGIDDAEIIAKQFGAAITPTDLVNLPRYTAYAKLLFHGSPVTLSLRTLPPVRVVDANRASIIRRQQSLRNMVS